MAQKGFEIHMKYLLLALLAIIFMVSVKAQYEAGDNYEAGDEYDYAVDNYNYDIEDDYALMDEEPAPGTVPAYESYDEFSVALATTANTISDKWLSKSSIDYKQYDSRWALVKMGNSGHNLKAKGCLVTAVANHMAAKNRKIKGTNTLVNPGNLAKKVNFDKWGGLVHSSVSNAVSGATFVGSYSVQRSANQVKAWFNAGYSVVVSMWYNNPGSNDHWLSVTKVSSTGVVVKDPAGKRTSLPWSKMTGYRVYNL